MTELVQFPGLGLEFNINRIALELGPLTITWYGIFAATAICIAMIYIYKRAHTFGVDGDKMVDIIIFTVFGGIVGARAYFVAFKWDQYKDNLLDVFKIWEGGIAIYGGIIGGFLVILFMTRKMKMKLFPVLDLVTAPLLLGQAIGRWGNFVNVEAFGSNTTMPWGMTSQSISYYLERQQAELSALGVMVDPTMPVHPTFFYESLWCFIGFLLIVWLTNRRRFDGQLSLVCLGWYGFGRFIIEGLRTDSLVWGTVRVSQALALVLAISSAVVLFMVMKKIKDKNDSNYLKLDVLVQAETQALAQEIGEEKAQETVILKEEQAKEISEEQAEAETPEAEPMQEVSLSEETETTPQPEDDETEKKQ